MLDTSISVLDRIVSDLHDVEDIDRAVAACRSIDSSADESWLPRLHDLLANGRDFFVREAAAYPIARLEGLQALPQLLYALHLGEEEGHDNDGLVALIADLVSANPQEAAPALSRLIHETSEYQRSAGAWLWGFAAKSLPLEPLLALLHDQSPRVRAAVVGSLGSYENRELVFDCLVKSLEDPDYGVKCSAATSLGYYGNRLAIDPLRRLLTNSHGTLQPIVERAIQQLEE